MRKVAVRATGRRARRKALARSWAGGTMFDVINARKLCVALDLEQASDRAAFESLCADADVVINTGELSPEEAAQQIVLHLEREGFIGVNGASA